MLGLPFGGLASLGDLVCLVVLVCKCRCCSSSVCDGCFLSFCFCVVVVL